MADVFISYARPDEPQARRIADALRAQGYSVWRDNELPAHRPFADVIAERLKSSRAVVVIWSAAAATSHWVRAEADLARQLETLVQAAVDGSIPPLPFNQIQCADLTGWSGCVDQPGWQKLQESVAALVGDSSATEAREPAPAIRRAVSVCVLPFANMSGDAEQEYFSDGISEDITTDLSKVSALSVTARNTAFMFKGQAADICDIARRLGVSHVLEGSVRKAGRRVRISAQLIDGRSGDHVWAERYDRKLTDIFSIQDEITKEIVSALKLKLLPEERKAIEQRGTTSAEAYNFYLMARDCWSSGNHGDRHREERVIRLCKRAVEIDPVYAQAWAMMATAQSTLRYGFGVAGEDGVAAAEKALAADPSIVEAHCPLARGLIEQGRYDQAEAVIDRALQADPSSWDAHYEGSRLRLRQRQFRKAADHLERCISIVETDFYSAGMLLSLYHALGDPVSERRAAGTALARAESALQHDPNNGSALSVGAKALASLGEISRAKEWIERGLLLDPDNLNMRYNFAALHAAFFNEPEVALNLLEPTIAKASGHLIRWAEQVDPDVDAIRDDPRFKQMMAESKARVSQTSKVSAKRESQGAPTRPASAGPLRS
jgi:adenylate cyclase